MYPEMHMPQVLLDLNRTVNGFVWGPPMLVTLVFLGVFLTLRTGFIQFTRFRLVVRETMGSLFRGTGKARGDVSPFMAMAVAMGGTVGVGNIAGVATAIAAGGPGAVFWMLVSGIVGMATKYGEVVLGVHYRQRRPGEPMIGGPMMYIVRGMGKRWKPPASLFAVFGALAAPGIGNMTQAQTVADGMEHFNVPSWLTGLFLIVVVGLVTVGGIKRIAHVACFIVPFMSGIVVKLTRGFLSGEPYQPPLQQ